MKICFITSFFPGATIPLIEHLQENGHQCDIYFQLIQGCKGMETIVLDSPVHGSHIKKLSKNNKLYNYLKKEIDFNIVPYYQVRNRKYLIGYVPFFKNLYIIHKMIKEVEKGLYDIIYLIVNEENDSIVARELKRRGYKNVVIAYHEVVKSHTGKPKSKDVVDITSKLGYPLICYSEHTKKKLLEFVDNGNIHVTYFGPFETYNLFDTSEPIIQEPYILFIGSIQPYKGLPFLYESIRDCGQNINTKIVVAGSGYDSCLEDMKKDNRYIVINKFLSDEDFANLTRYASCVVCPYVSGSQSGITHTAMVYGTPVIATKVGAFPEFVEEGNNGDLIDYGDKEGLTRSIEKYINNESVKQYYVPNKLRWDMIVNTLERMLSTINKDI